MNIELSKETKNNMKLFNLSYPYSKAALKKTYRELVMKYHPDHNPNIPEDKIKSINIAFKNLSQFALDKIEVKQSLSEELKRKFQNEKEDIFTLYNPCTKCNGTGISYDIITVSEECTNCGGTGEVELKCKYCNGSGKFKTRRGFVVNCKVCYGTGIWKRVRCNQCNKHYNRNRGLWWNLVSSYFGPIGTVYKEKKIEKICSTCKGRGKVKYEPLNPVIKKGAILKTIKKK